MSVQLRKRKNADGSISLRLDIYHNGQRTIETLKHLKLSKVSNVMDREHNKRMLQQAETIKAMRAADLEANNYDIDIDKGKMVVVTTWMQNFIDVYTKKDKRNLQGALKRFIEFLDTKNLKNVTFNKLTAFLIEEFIEFLESKSIGEGASSYYNRFKKMLKIAFRQKLMKTYIVEHVERKVKGKAKKRHMLTLPELEILVSTPIESIEVRNAFLFCCVTGLRWCDIKSLKWENINLKEKYLSFKQLKTGEENIVSLNETAIVLIGNSKDKKELVFKLPTANGANKTIKAWIKRAKIEKEITWHNARHSFGTNLILNGSDVYTTSRLMGHKSLKYTQRYVDIAKEMRENATDKLVFNL